MMLPSRLAFAASAEEEEGLWLLHVVESSLSLEEKMPVDELLSPGAIGFDKDPKARWPLSQCCTEVVRLAAAEY